jgi:glutamate synthase (NADPH/NADH) large chain
VRNSGATAVIEGVGDNACEYMTNGTVLVLGSTGRNFAAGMSGGKAFCFDLHDTLLDRYNPGMVELSRVAQGSADEAELRALIEEHVRETESARGAHVLHHWEDALAKMWKITPNVTPANQRSQSLQHVPLWTPRTLNAKLGDKRAEKKVLPLFDTQK